jgi:hypothetical protein
MISPLASRRLKQVRQRATVGRQQSLLIADFFLARHRQNRILGLAQRCRVNREFHIVMATWF